jgi:hypothetical protein
MANFAIFGNGTRTRWAFRDSWGIITNPNPSQLVSNSLTVGTNRRFASILSNPVSLDDLANPATAEYFLTFDILGEMHIGSKFVIEVVLDNGTEVDWVIKRDIAANTNITNFSEKLLINKGWFSGQQTFRIRLTFYQNPSSDSFVTISNLKIAYPNPPQPNNVIAAAARTTNGTGTSGPNGPR